MFFNFRLAVRLGSLTRVNFTIEIPVIKTILHEDYVAKSYLNDIGLLKLDSYALKKEYINSRNGMLSLTSNLNYLK